DCCLSLNGLPIREAANPQKYPRNKWVKKKILAPINAVLGWTRITVGGGAEPPPIMTIIGVIFGSDNEPWSRRNARQALIFMFGFNVRENPCDEKLGFANSLRGSNCQRVARCTGCTVPWRDSLSGTVRPNGSRLHRGRANRRDRTYHRGKTFDIYRTAIL